MHYITEVATTKHTVGRGNKSGIRRTVERSKGRHISDVTTKYSFKHPDGKRHVHVRFEGRQYDNKPHREETLSWAVAHDEAGHGHVKKIVSSEPHHTGEILSKVHSITKHHLENSPKHMKEVSWTSESLIQNMEHLLVSQELARKQKYIKDKRNGIHIQIGNILITRTKCQVVLTAGHWSHTN